MAAVKLTSLRYILPEPFISLRRNFGMTVAAIMTVVLTLYLCGIFGILVVNIDRNATIMESAVEIKVFIKDGINQDQMDTLSAQVKSIPGVASVKYVSRAEGLELMSSKFGSSEEILAAIDTNPLPNSYTVKAESPEQVLSIVDAVNKLDNILAVRYGQGSVEKMFVFMNWIRSLGTGLMVLLGFSAVILISMNIRLSVEARKEEIQVMKYVGASNSFIIWPFILEGMLLGVLGGGVACILALMSYNAMLNLLLSSLNFLTFTPFGSIALPLVGAMLLIGLLLGAVGSAIAVRKHVNV